MRRLSGKATLGAGFGLAMVSCTALAQIGALPAGRIDKATDAVQKVQQRATAATERAEKAQDRVEKTQERVTKAAEQAARVQDVQARVERLPDQTDRVEKAQERIERLPEQAARTERAQERLERIPDQAARSERAQERSARAPGQAERSERAQDRSARAGEAPNRSHPEWGQRGGRSAEHARAPDWSNRGGRADEHARSPEKGRPDEPGARGKGKDKRASGEKPASDEEKKKKKKQEALARGKPAQAPAPGAELVAFERSLAQQHRQRLLNLVLAHPRNLEMTEEGPAVRGQVVAIDPTPAILAAVRRAGFVILWQDRIESLGLYSVTLRVPKGVPVEQALARLAKIAPRGQFAANHLHIQSSAHALPALSAAATIVQGRVTAPAIGLIDGGVARHPVLTGAIEQKGFVYGAPAPNAHATAVASLAAGQGRLKGAFPGAPLLVADVYGRDPGGGNAVAVAKALGWMVERRVPVVAITLAGPSNPLVAKAVQRASERGLFIVAPVGNSGRASPPSYPASYPQVVAVTGVDEKNRLLIESGRAFGIDYAAPAAGFAAANAAGGWYPVRGTSFAVPFVAGRMAGAQRSGAHPITLLDREALDLGPRGPDDLYGRGLICAKCRPKR